MVLEQLGRLFARPGAVFAMVGAGLALTLAIQVGWQTGGRNDDAELLLFSQTLAWGYDPLNPPLVVWLNWLMAQAMGPTLLSTRLLVAGLVFAAYPLAWGAARELTADRGMAALAALSLATLVAWAWTPWLNLSHSVALTTAALALLWAVLRLMRRPTWGAWLLVGGIAGLGLLTKYNFALVLTAVLGAGLLSAGGRRVLADWRLLAAALVTTVIAAPHYLWLLRHRAEFADLFDRKLGRADDAAGGWDGAGIVEGLSALGEHALMVLLPAAALALLLFAPALWRALVRPEPIATATAERLTVAALVPLLVAAQMAALVLVAGVTDFNPHHVYPLILALVPLFGWLARGRPGAASRGLFALVALGLIVVPPVFLARFIVQTAEDCETKCNIVLPYRDYAEGVQQAGFRGGTVVVVTSVHAFPLANLRPWLPEGRFIKPLDSQKGDWRPPARAEAGACLVLWREGAGRMSPERLRRDGVPGAGAGEGANTALPADATFGRVEGTLALSGRPAPVMGYALMPGGVGACR
jgi:hypothetical protein